MSPGYIQVCRHAAIVVKQPREHVMQCLMHAATCLQAIVELEKGAHPELGSDLSRLRLSVDSSIPDILHIKITDADKDRWEVPTDLLSGTPEELAGENTHRIKSWHDMHAVQCCRLCESIHSYHGCF